VVGGPNIEHKNGAVLHVADEIHLTAKSFFVRISFKECGDFESDLKKFKNTVELCTIYG
jgi:hypothetical protein